VVKRGGQGARLALVDLEMPYMDGAETVRFLKKANPTLPIIAIGTTQGKLDKGLAGTLSRPFTTRALLQAVSKSI
jgi:CheY-like chemotaxis protein